MKVLANTLRPGHAIEHEGKKYVVVKYELKRTIQNSGNSRKVNDIRENLYHVIRRG